MTPYLFSSRSRALATGMARPALLVGVVAVAAALGGAGLTALLMKPSGAPTAPVGTAHAAQAQQTAVSAHAAAPQVAAPVAPQWVAMTPELERLVKVGAVGEGIHEEFLRVAASVQADEQRVARIGSAVTGRITDISVQLGDPVQAGQRLATISSPELATAQMNYLQSISTLQVAQRAAERAAQLLAADVIGSAEAQRRDSEASSQRAAVDANRSMLKVLGMSPEAIARLERTRQVDPTIGITSTRSGVVLERRLSIGQVVQPSDPVFMVADLRQVWVVADVPEQMARDLTVGDKTKAEVPSLDNRRLEGALVFVSNTVNPDTRTIQVRMNVPNADGKLKPAMLATMLVREDANKSLTIPREAVVRENDQDMVFVKAPGGQFKLAPVKLGPESNGKRQVMEGLSKGQAIVISGAFHMNAARKVAGG